MRGPCPRVVLGLHRSRHERPLLTGALDLGVTSVDTSANYFGFRSHTVLARTAGDLLPRLMVSTKVGCFPGRERAERSLDPVRLYEAVEHAARDLGREPDLVFLYNPEHSLGDASAHGRGTLAQACAALDDATSKGLCGAWGVASWDPFPLVGFVDLTTPKPSILMARAGLLVGTRTLEAAEALAVPWDLDRSRLWGMSPFGGSAADPVWDRIDPRVFLRGGDGFSRVQAAFRTSYCLPGVGTMAVGTNDAAHLGELLDALAAEPDEQTIHEYRTLLRERSMGQPV
ncbi:aldo/keto reductase [Streptomyces sp. HSW2009]|uniref:aldo/keto reductase n=1 Tax=Streptomyces sp. HSW2009 TaxID=3142890 RepID=UPI0032EF17F7